MLELAVKTLIAYLLGSLMGALILGAFRGVDIRQQGSGNAGGTNALRTQGKAFALGVVVIDVAKGWFAAGVLPGLALPLIALDASVGRDWLSVSCAAAVTLGHVYPVWWEFRGGKGAATLIGVVLGLIPAFLPAVLIVWLLVVMTTGFVGLGTMLGVATLPVVLLWRAPGNTAILSFALLMTVFVIYTHRGNIERMRAGSENRARRLWLLGRLKARAE
ncbi:MAG: glycerol-3-phosphate 1-O-acyltransferase PlsY [Proteobacteria bacterium]|nr:glycerol-3-phosphate 1-O-acyltransferase PlsY [Pseudomonadota bacterium]